MLYFEYKPESYLELLHSYARVLNTNVIDNRIVIPEVLGKGDINYIKLFDGSEAVISDYILNELLLIRRMPTRQTNYVLIIDGNDRMRFSISNVFDKKNYAHENGSYALLSTSLLEYSAMVPDKTFLRNIIISLPSHWVAGQLKAENENTVLNQYLTLRSQQKQFIPLDETFKQLLSNILDVERADPLYEIKINSGITNIIAYFFITLQQLFEGQKKIASSLLPPEEIERLNEVEKLIIQSLNKDDAPEIEELAKAASMSTSTLQRKFKRFYNQGIYEYYYNYRLEEARRLLLVKEMTVQDVAYTLGFKDPAHFTRSYKKKFGFTPSQT